MRAFTLTSRSSTSKSARFCSSTPPFMLLITSTTKSPYWSIAGVEDWAASRMKVAATEARLGSDSASTAPVPPANVTDAAIYKETERVNKIEKQETLAAEREIEMVPKQICGTRRIDLRSLCENSASLKKTHLLPLLS